MTFYFIYFDVLATAGNGFAERNLHDLELLESLVSQICEGFFILSLGIVASTISV